MTTMTEFLNDRWNYHRTHMTHTPTTERTDCTRTFPSGVTYAAHGGDWDRWEWRGDDYNTERAHCTHCGQMVRGAVSPWADAALADWYETPYMIRHFRETKIRHTHRWIKLSHTAGRRRVVFNNSEYCFR